MTAEMSAVVAAMQMADGQFPSGAFAFSWGLENLVREGRLGRGRLAAVMRAELDGRWASFDRYFIDRGMQAGGLEGIVELDAEIEAMCWSEPLRAGSRGAGGGLLTTHARLGTPGAAEFRAAVLRDETHGHLPLVQGVVLGGLGLTRPLAFAAAGHGLLSGLGSAAVRLGVAGAMEVQAAIASLRPRLAELAEAPPPDEPSTFSPILEIAMMRRTDGAAALFAN